MGKAYPAVMNPETQTPVSQFLADVQRTLIRRMFGYDVGALTKSMSATANGSADFLSP
jgi:hypothetical protein